eukprot:Skav230408  [mRNA]  locus=scaffold4006:49586:55817:+ [translate_table: standard]
MNEALTNADRYQKNVEPKAKASSRRFQPPRRKERVSKARDVRNEERVSAPCNEPYSTSCAPMPLPPHPRASATSAQCTRAPPGAPPSAPSAEMAWLLRVSEKFDEEAAQVHAFLAEHSLEQYASLLDSGPGALGSSMEALQAATSELLEQVGLPLSPRQRLLRALEEETEPEGGHQDFAPHWGRLGQQTEILS